MRLRRPAPSSAAAARLLLPALAAFAAPGALRAEQLTGGVGAAYSTPDGVSVNPANAAFLDRTQIGYNPNIFASESYFIRYPGFETTSHGDSGVQAPVALPTFVWKASPKLGIGGFLAPPGITLPVEIKRVPIIVLKTQNYVDIVGSAKLKGAVLFNVGYRFGNLGVGAGGMFGGADVEAKITPSEGGDPLVTVSGSASVGTVKAGVRYDVVPGRVAVGASFDVISMQSIDLKFESPLIGDGGDGLGGGGTGGSPIRIVNPLDSMTVGAQIAFTPRARLLVDLKWARAAEGAEQFSFTDLKQKPKDVHDVLAVSAGGILGVGDSSNAMLGFAYQPASVGPGRPASEDDDGLAGYGTMDVIGTFAPFVGAELQPYWQLGGGLQFGFSPQADRVPGKKRGEGATRYYYAWTVASGVVYRRASLGIDENGELPGAYLRTSASIPVQVTYRF